MRNIWLLSTATFREGIRNKFLFGIFFFAIAMCGANFIITTSFTRDLGKVAVDIGLSTISISGLAIILFLGMSLLAKDLDKLTIYMILSKPVPRWQYIVGKYCGLCLLILFSVLVLGLLTAFSVKMIMGVNPAYIPPLFSWGKFSIAVFLSLLSLLILTSLSMLFTCLTSSPFMALVLTFCSYFAGQNIEFVRHLLNQNPNGGSTFILIKIIAWLFPNLSAFDYKTIAAYGLKIETIDIINTTIYGISYIALVLFITTMIFNRRELT